jgi:cytochrome c
LKLFQALAWAWTALSLPLSAHAGFDAHGGPVKDVALSADGRRALTASFDYSLLLWDLDGQTVLAELHGHDAAVNAVTFTPDDRHALSASDDGTVGVWDLAAGSLVARLEGHRGKVAAIAIAPDGRTAASAGWDRTIRLWDLETRQPGLTLEASDNLNAVQFSPDGERLLAGASDGSLAVWRVVDGVRLAALQAHDFAVTGLDQDPGGKLAATS